MKLVLLQSLAGDGFSITPGQLIVVDKASGKRLLEQGIARECLASLSEPTELQLVTEFTLSTDVEAKEAVGEVVDTPPAPAPQRTRRNASKSQP